jgi:hypothetical protein
MQEKQETMGGMRNSKLLKKKFRFDTVRYRYNFSQCQPWHRRCRDFCPTDVCPTDVCPTNVYPTVRPRHLSDPNTHRHLSDLRLKMRHLSDLYIKCVICPTYCNVCATQHLSDPTFFQTSLKCLSICLSLLLYISFFFTSSNPLSESRLDAGFRN